MRQFLTLPILVPIVLGIALLILQPKSRRVRSIYIMAASLATTALSLACIVLTYLYGSGFLACIMVRFNEAFSISLRIDGASMVYGAIVSVLWPLVTAYSLDYMSHEGHENRFFAFWLMAYGVVLGIAYSEDFLTLYFFYEVLTLTTLPLVMHAMDEKARYAGRKYLVYSLSGAAFAFIGIVFLLNYGVGHLNFTYGGILDQSLAAGNERTLELVFVAAFFGFGVKAAVFPFHGWLPDASVAPTPVSALLHAVAVVKAGAFAVLRLIYYGFGADFLRGSWAQTVVMTAAIVTIVYGSARALRTPHLKRRLAFSTVSNLSYILFALTLMTPAGMVGGMTHMVYHAFTKITMFCCAGAIILKSGKEYIYEMEDFGRAMPVVFATFTVSSFALIGMPPLGGFAGKWMIAEAAVASVNPLAYAGIAALILSTLLTTLYMLTIVVRAYFPVGELDRAALARVHDPARTMWIPLVLLILRCDSGAAVQRSDRLFMERGSAELVREGDDGKHSAAVSGPVPHAALCLGVPAAAAGQEIPELADPDHSRSGAGRCTAASAVARGCPGAAGGLWLWPAASGRESGEPAGAGERLPVGGHRPQLPQLLCRRRGL